MKRIFAIMAVYKYFKFMPNEKKKLVLIAEDDTMIGSMYRTKLEASGFEVIIANNGGDALKLALENRPDILLLDIIMPQLDGFSVMQELAINDKTKKIPVIFLTNLGTEEDIDKGKKLGAADYIVKANLTPTEVVEKVKKYIG